MAATARCLASGFRDRPPLHRRDVALPVPAPCLSSVDTEESGVGAPVGFPPNLKRKSASQPAGAGPPDLKRRSKEPAVDISSDALSQLSLVSLNDTCLLVVFSKLYGVDCARAACVCRRWQQLAGDERLWEALCRRVWGLSQPRTPDLRPATFRDSYIAWQHGHSGYGRLAVRAHVAWWNIETWLLRHAPAIQATLRPGATEVQLAEAELLLGVTFPLAMRALYRVHDGQELPADAAADMQGQAQLEAVSTLHGLFGGYCYYDQAVSVRMLPLHRLVLWTQRLRAQVFNTTKADPRIVFAGNFNLKKVLVLDCGSGIVKACLADKNKAVPAVPPDTDNNACDGMLRWLEEYARRLKEGVYMAEVQPNTLEETRIPRTLAISLFPAKPPVWTWAITRGVRVSVTTVFVPEGTRAVGRDISGNVTKPRFFFVYSTRLALLSEKEQREAGVTKPLPRVQLARRHWVMRNAQGGKVDETGGDGVVGVQPILYAGGEAFTYASCTPQPRLPMVLQGEFTFVQGVLADAGAAEFNVKIPTVILKLPTYIY